MGKIGGSDRTVCHWRLPWPHHLVAHGQAAHRAVANGDEEGFVRHRGKAQHPLHSFFQAGFSQAQRLVFRRTAVRMAVHLRRFAQQYCHGHVNDRLPAEEHVQAWRSDGFAHHRIGAAFARADGREAFYILRHNREHVTFLRFVAPNFHGRQARVCAGHLRQIDAPAQAAGVQQFRQRIGQSARAHVVNR